jgi:membrane protein DedA with SNARE-associated domain
VVTVAGLGYYFGSQWERLLEIMKGADIALLVVAVAVVAAWWHRQRRGAA